MALLSPSVNGLRNLLQVCERYAVEHGLRYNAKKSEVLIFGEKLTNRLPSFTLAGGVLNRVQQFKYLGHIVTANMKDELDVERERRALAVRSNMLVRSDFQLRRRPRSRGPRGGRGVRTRGGRGVPLEAVRVVAAEVERDEVAGAVHEERGEAAVTAAVTARGRGGRRPAFVTARGRSGRTAHGGRGRGRGLVRPGPQGIDELNIRQVHDMPHGVAMETALHPKRRRMWHPSDGDNLRVAPSSAPPRTPPPPMVVEASTSAVPSPAMFVECGGSAAGTPSSHSRSRYEELVMGGRRFLPVDAETIREAMADPDFFGSEPCSAESGDEDDPSPEVHLPRAVLSLMDTPLDEDDEAAFVDASTIDLDVDPMVTDQPRSYYDFNWVEFPSVPIRPESRREKFTNINVGPTTPCVDPYDIFVAIWDRQIMEHIVSETNRYAQQLAQHMMLNNTLHPRSRISRWSETTVDEIYAYFAILLTMGIVVKSRLEEYWRANSNIFCTPGFIIH